MLHARMWPYMSLSNKRHFWISTCSKIRTNYLLNYSKEKLSPYKFKDSKILLPSQQKINLLISFFIKVFEKNLGSLSYPIFLAEKYFCNFPLQRPNTPVAFFWPFFFALPSITRHNKHPSTSTSQKIHLCQFTQYRM